MSDQQNQAADSGVIACLEKALAAAREGRISTVCLVTLGGPNGDVNTAWSALGADKWAVIGAVTVLQHDLLTKA